MTLFGGIEAGGTKFNCAIGTSPTDIRAQTRIPTTTPAETLARVLAFFQSNPAVSALGIGSFGPIDPSPTSPTFGYITTTPKPGWANVDFAGTLQRALNIPVAFDTDVNVAALGEWRWGTAQGLTDFVYLTVGTGVGGGGMINGKLMHGLLHPEMGHMLLPTMAGDTFVGNCPYHGNCLEGLVSGPAIAARVGVSAETLPSDHPAWAMVTHYLAAALHNIVCTLSPQRIIIGGGVMAQPQLFPAIRTQLQHSLQGYIQKAALFSDIDNFVVAPKLGSLAGIAGAITLAQQAFSKSSAS